MSVERWYTKEHSTDLRECKHGGGGVSYTDIVAAGNWLNLTKTSYINGVSPLWPENIRILLSANHLLLQFHC